jgi:hypothetical protein
MKNKLSNETNLTLGMVLFNFIINLIERILFVTAGDNYHWSKL